MKLSLQYTSEVDKEFIKEAAKLKNTEDAENAGWVFIGSGVYKSSYKKGNIVVKFDRHCHAYENHMLNEIKLYQNTTKSYKKYLARIFGGDKNKIIQKLVDYDKEYKYSIKEKDRIYYLGQKLGISDFSAGANVVKARDKTIKFYDFAGQMIH